MTIPEMSCCSIWNMPDLLSTTPFVRIGARRAVALPNQTVGLAGCTLSIRVLSIQTGHHKLSHISASTVVRVQAPSLCYRDLNVSTCHSQHLVS